MESSADYANNAAQSLIAYALLNSLDGYDLNFQTGLNEDWVKQWTSIVSQLVVSSCLYCVINVTVATYHICLWRSPRHHAWI